MTAHAIAGWVTLAVVVIVAALLAVRAVALIAHVRRLRRRLDHPTLQRLAATAADAKRLQAARVQFEALAARATAALALIRSVGAERARLRRETGAAVNSILSNLRAIRKLFG